MRISLEKIRQGVTLSKQKCIEHLSSAELLASNGLANNAVVNLEFAIEEFGRAIALNENLKNSETNVDDNLQKDHLCKYNKAWTVLPVELKTIYEGTFDPVVFDPAIFDTGKETVSPKTRLDATFVNYNQETEEWETGVRANPNKIFEISKQIKASIGAVTWY